jgi:hypothetical protein
MRTLSVLLGASILLNLVLIARRPAPPPEPPRRPAPARAVAPAATTPPDREVAELRSRVRELEAERTARPEAVVAAPAADPRSAFREKLLRALGVWRDPKRQMSLSPEAQLELSEVMLGFQRARLERFQDPRAYVDLLRTALERMDLDSKKPLAEAQKLALSRTLEEYEAALAGLEGADAWDRYAREMGAEADVLQRLRTFLTPELEARMAMFGGLSPSSSTAPWIERRQADTQVVQTWMSAYGLEEAQRSAVAAAARVYLNSADALNAQMGAAAAPGRESPEWRRRTGQILLDALRSLEGSLTPEQRERLRGRRPAEVRVFDGFTQQRWSRERP